MLDEHIVFFFQEILLLLLSWLQSPCANRSVLCSREVNYIFFFQIRNIGDEVDRRLLQKLHRIDTGYSSFISTLLNNSHNSQFL